MVTFVSQCEKNALKKTRRVLDAFANRIGDNTWQTIITEDGLLTVKKMLRKTASKNTAVSCHWIRSRSRSQFLWVVGNKRKFDNEGRVPVNITRRDTLRKEIENNWFTGEDIKLLSQMAALLHDLGKASIAFQNRLRGKLSEKNLYRHEWVSLRLFLAFVGKDDDESWLRRMISLADQDETAWTQTGRFWRDGIDEHTPLPFEGLPSLASAVAWLVVTHHRLPVIPVYDSFENRQLHFGAKCKNFRADQLPELLRSVNADWNEIVQQSPLDSVIPYWTFETSLPFELPKWRKRAAVLADKLLRLTKFPGKGDWLNNPYIMHLARLSLMAADHHYSSLPPDSKDRVQGDAGDSLFANTHKDGSLKQTLSEHLLGVARLTGSIAHSLSHIERHLPRLADHRGLAQRSGSPKFRWQDKAAEAAAELRQPSEKSGAFIVNMASTGCGKTLANARILYSLSNPDEGMRASFALGLRTLTLQTGRSYREDLRLSEDELAIRVGGSANRALFEFYEAQAEASGSASTQDLMEEDGYVAYEGFLDEHPVLSKALADRRIRSLISAPILVCTIDHLMPATEAQRAGRQIAPMLRLMSSDLVLDELDDFDIDDLPALTRLVHWAGLLGSRIVISSATLPPSLVEAMFQSYLEGRKHFYRNRNELGAQGDTKLSIPCLWVDEFSVQSISCGEYSLFVQDHARFVSSRVSHLDKAIKKNGATRRGNLLPLKVQSSKREDIYREFAVPVYEAILRAHSEHHEVCPMSGKRVSFGLVRMANIEPLISMAREFFGLGAPENFRFHLCVYHSRFPLVLRSAIEHQLDTTLNRRVPNAVYEKRDIRALIDSHPEQNHVFIVLGSPVTEVGRDHDYDWAIVEPSSMRSLIQLAGRVQRHRQQRCESPNVLIFNKNLRHFYKEKAKNGYPKAVFVKPGFEKEEAAFRLTSHNLEKLLNPKDYQIITAKPRVQPHPQPWKATTNLVDLEHARLADCMQPKDFDAAPAGRGQKPPDMRLNSACIWQFPQSALTWVLPQQQPFRLNLMREETLVFLPDDDEEGLILHRVHQVPTKGKPAIYTSEANRLTIPTLEMGRGIGVWGQYDLMSLLRELAQDQDMTLIECAAKFTSVNVPESIQGWQYHPALGFCIKK